MSALDTQAQSPEYYPLPWATLEHPAQHINGIQPLRLERRHRRAVTRVLARESNRSQITYTTEGLSLRELTRLAHAIRSRVSNTFGTMAHARNEIIASRNIDLTTHTNALGQIWDTNVSDWYGQTTAISRGVNQQLEAIGKTIEAKQPKVVTLYHPTGEAFQVDVVELDHNCGLLGMFVKVRTKNTSVVQEYDLSLEQFQRMQQPVKLSGPASNLPEAVNQYVEQAFADTKLKICTWDFDGKAYAIEYKTPEGRKYKLHCTLEPNRTSSINTHQLVIKKIVDCQNILTPTDYNCFIGEAITAVQLQLLHGKSNFLNSDGAFHSKPTQTSFLERAIGKAKSWLF